MSSSEQEQIWESAAGRGRKLLFPTADHMFLHTLNAILPRLEFWERAAIRERLAPLRRVLNRKTTQWCFIMKTLRRTDWFTHIGSPLFNFAQCNHGCECLLPPGPFVYSTSAERQPAGRRTMWSFRAASQIDAYSSHGKTNAQLCSHWKDKWS